MLRDYYLKLIQANSVALFNFIETSVIFGLRQRFLKEAEKEWDDGGEGYFNEFITQRMAEKMLAWSLNNRWN